jgi:hypothetical protein
MELIITVLALLAAVYAVTPRERQLDLRLRIGVLDWLVIAAGFLLVMCLEFRDFRIARGWLLTTRRLPVGITAKNSMYLVLLAVAAFVALRIKFSRLTKGKIFKFRELVEELYWAGSYGELFTLIQKHLKELFKIYDSEFFLSRVRSSLDRLIFLDFLKALDEIRDLNPEAHPATMRPIRTRFSVHVRSLVAPLLPRLLGFYRSTTQRNRQRRNSSAGLFVAKIPGSVSENEAIFRVGNYRTIKGCI